jgi:hypothetical protein
MEAWQLILLGGGGGFLPGLIDFNNQIQAWKAARRNQLSSPDGARGPDPIGKYYDFGPCLLATFTQVALGAGTVYLLIMCGQMQGPYAAVAVGSTAPTLLSQIGRIDVFGKRIATEQQTLPMLERQAHLTATAEASTQEATSDG